MKTTLVTLACAALTIATGSLAAEASPPQDAASEYQRRLALPEPQRCKAGEAIVMEVPLADAMQLETSYDAANQQLRIFYRMDFNHVTEGWNWHPEIPPLEGDYYTFKYLPLGSMQEERSRYRDDAMPGVPDTFRVIWQYDYYFAFDNPNAFYARDPDTENGFVANISMPAADAARLQGGDLRMMLRGELAPRCLADSNTYFRGTLGRLVDLSLKKRYLIGTLTEVSFHDAATGQTLARIGHTGHMGRHPQ